MDSSILLKLRILAGLSQSGLADRFGISRATVARWEAGASPIPKWVELAFRGM